MRSLRLAIAALVATVALAAAPAAHAGAAADFSLRDLNGAAQTLSQHRGKVVLLNFWQAF